MALLLKRVRYKLFLLGGLFTLSVSIFHLFRDVNQITTISPALASLPLDFLVAINRSNSRGLNEPMAALDQGSRVDPISFMDSDESAGRRTGPRACASLTSGDQERIDLYISIGSKPDNTHVRSLLRESWLQWIKPLEERFQIRIVYRIFTETTDATVRENERYGDLVLTTLPIGYHGFFRRFFAAVEWPMQELRACPRFQVKMDDDVFLCLPTLVRDLFGSQPEDQASIGDTPMLFWGKYFCGDGMRVADENFMVFSSDLIDTLIALRPHLRANENATFAAHFGLWQHLLPITVFDDRNRLDNQQGRLTSYMEGGAATAHEAAQFCTTYLAAHHVRSPDVFRKSFGGVSMEDMIVSETNQPPRTKEERAVICKGKQTKYIFDPSRTSLGGHFPKLRASETYSFSRLLHSAE